uniref:Uncharacterized protein n=1 Tax=Rhizophora mucronata TaxID=61149 RepID=A0A2P2QX95_RHIMU
MVKAKKYLFLSPLAHNSLENSCHMELPSD